MLVHEYPGFHHIQDMLFTWAQRSRKQNWDKQNRDKANNRYTKNPGESSHWSSLDLDYSCILQYFM